MIEYVDSDGRLSYRATGELKSDSSRPEHGNLRRWTLSLLRRTDSVCCLVKSSSICLSIYAIEAWISGWSRQLTYDQRRTLGLIACHYCLRCWRESDHLADKWVCIQETPRLALTRLRRPAASMLLSHVHLSRVATVLDRILTVTAFLYSISFCRMLHSFHTVG